jgi:transcription elongation factor GreA
MQVPKRKPKKLSTELSDPYITPQKYAELKQELDFLVEKKQPQAAIEVQRLAEMGDFSENAAYQIAKGRLRRYMYRINELTNYLKAAQIITTSKGVDHVVLGSRVTVELNGNTFDFTILGSTEANPAAGVISQNSKLGMALLRKKVGEIATIDVDGRTLEYRIVSITNT